MAKATVKPATKVSAADLLGSIGKQSTAKAASKTPTISVKDQNVLVAMHAVITAKNRVKSEESALKVAEESLRETATEMFEGKCLQDHTLHTSVRFAGTLALSGDETEQLSLMYTQPRAVCKMPEDESKEVLESIFDEQYDDMFKSQRTINIDTDALDNDKIVALVQAMQQALGTSFDDVVTVERLIVPKEVFYTKRVLDANVKKLAQRVCRWRCGYEGCFV